MSLQALQGASSLDGFIEMIPQWIDDARENTDLEIKLIQAIKILWEAVDANVGNVYAHGYPARALLCVEKLGE